MQFIQICLFQQLLFSGRYDCPVQITSQEFQWQLAYANPTDYNHGFPPLQ